VSPLWPLGAAVVCLSIGLWLSLHVAPRSGTPAQTMVIAWVLIAMTPVLVLTSVLPESEVSVTVKTVSATGGMRKSREAMEVDRLRARLTAVEAELEDSRQAAARLPLPTSRRVRYPVSEGDTDRVIGVITGSLEGVKGVDLWVNSENTHMRMSRINERSISATIRYLGSQVDAFGDVTEDTIDDDLAQRMKAHNKAILNDYSVIVTGAGRLNKTHGVQRIIHVAAVSGMPGYGFRPVEDVGKCVRVALERAESEELDGVPAHSILLPLFGTGQAGGDVMKTVSDLMTPAIDFLRTSAKRIGEVYFLAYAKRDLEACTTAIESALGAAPLPDH
jgi:O-acetyl-ADP-ribose deacetylase (regulator of RNase III)